jgi:hypothetical protein
MHWIQIQSFVCKCYVRNNSSHYTYTVLNAPMSIFTKGFHDYSYVIFQIIHTRDRHVMYSKRYPSIFITSDALPAPGVNVYIPMQQIFLADWRYLDFSTNCTIS